MSNDTREALAAKCKDLADTLYTGPVAHKAACVRLVHAAIDELAALTEQPSDTKIRRMLCAMYAGSAAYMDDGEAQDNRAYPLIDFLRDTADEIASKMRERAQGALTEQPAAPRDEWSSVRSEIRAAHGAAPQAQAGPQVCKHGIRSPHECKDCADAASAEDIAAQGERELIRETIGFGFEPGELQTVNADDLLRLVRAASSPAPAVQPTPLTQEEHDAAMERISDALDEYDAEREQATRQAEAVAELVEALARLLRNFPTDDDMDKAGWHRADVDRACNAYDHAKRVAAKHGQPQGGQG